MSSTIGPIPHADAIACADTKQVVQRQLDVGLDVVSDGEFRRYMFLNSPFDGISGFSSEVSKAAFKTDSRPR